MSIQVDAAPDSMNRTGGAWCLITEGEVKTRHLGEEHARGIAALLGGEPSSTTVIDTKPELGSVRFTGGQTLMIKSK